MKKIIALTAIAAFSLMSFGTIAQTPQKKEATKEQQATTEKKACCKDKKEACSKDKKACCKDKGNKAGCNKEKKETK